jgi:hypothetical protein
MAVAMEESFTLTCAKDETVRNDNNNGSNLRFI